MKLCFCVLIVILAIAVPTQGLLGAKLALFGVLRNSIGGGGILGGNGNGGGGYGGGGYGGGGYGGGGYGSGGYGSGINYNRPVYTGQNSNYGWGQQSYGGGYSSGFNGGNDVKVIKLIVNHEQPQGFYDNYARNSAASASAVSTSAGSGWIPVAPAPVTQTFATQPLQAVQVAAPSSFAGPLQVQSPNVGQVPVQTIKVSAAIPAPPPAQVIQPPPRNFYIPAQPQSQYIQSSQAIGQQPQTILRQTQPIYQQPQAQAQESIRLIVDGDSQHVPAQTYGPPPPAPSYVAPNGVNAGAWNSNSWTNANLGSAWNNAGTGPWKSGSIWESVGC